MSGRRKGKPLNDVDVLLRRFGGNFRAARIALGFGSQSALSRSSGIDQPYISRIEQGAMRRLSLSMMVSLANLVERDVIAMLATEPPERDPGDD